MPAGQGGPFLEFMRQELAKRTSLDAARVKQEEDPEQAPAQPPRKRRRRRGLRDPRLQLSDDTMAIVLPYLAKTSVRHLFILSMVDHRHYSLVMDAHPIWRGLFVSWENKHYSRFYRSQGSEYATRCFQAMPRWMVPPGNFRVNLARRGLSPWNLSNMYTGPPLPGSDWRVNGVPADRQEQFGLYVRKCLALLHIGCCGVCGTRQGQQRAIWGLHMRVCRGCWLNNVISQRTLLQASLAFVLVICEKRDLNTTGLWN